MILNYLNGSGYFVCFELVMAESPAMVATGSDNEVQMKNPITAYESSSMHRQMQRSLQPLLQTTDMPTSGSIYKYLPCSSQYASNPLWQVCWWYPLPG